MKGLLFGGCSFTWGQGLYYYSDLPKQVLPPPDQYIVKDVTDAMYHYKNVIRYPRLVANHFNTFDVFKNVNGGSEDETFDFFDNIFNDPNRHKLHDHISHDRFTYNDFSYIIIQTSQVFRNRFTFDINGERFSSNVPPNADWETPHNLLKWLDINNYGFDDWHNLLVIKQYERLKERLQFYESNGIKVLFLSWENDFVNLINQDEYMNKRFVRLTYEDKTYDTIANLMHNHKHMAICHDNIENFILGDIPKDHHPSKLCHEVIAQNIIKKIENEL